MAFIITSSCIGTTDGACVDVCPVDCIYSKKGDKHLFINQDENPENLLARIKSLKQMQRKGKHDQVPPMPMDNKDFGIGAQILHDLGISNINLLSNSEQIHRVGLSGYGLCITNYTNY